MLRLSREVAKAQGVTVIQDVGGEDLGLGFMEPAPNHHFMGGMVTIPSHGGFMALVQPHFNIPG